MTQRGPWSVKGIDDRARQAARDAARVEGLTLGAYLNKLILEEGSTSDDDTAHTSSQETPRPKRAEPLGTQSTRTAQEIASSALDRLTRRIETTEARSTLAITGIDQSVVGLLSRLENAEHTQEAFSIHIDSVLAEIKEAHAGLAGKISELEADDTAEASLAALRSLEDALGKLAAHVYEENGLAAEESEAVKLRLETGLGDLNERIETIDARIESQMETAKHQLSEAVSTAELRSEGATRHLSERFTSLELDVADKLSHIDGLGQIMNGVHAELSDAVAGVRRDASDNIGSINSALEEIQLRLTQAESVTNAALRGLEQTCENLDKRLAGISTTHSGSETNQELRNEFEERFEAIADDLRTVVASARAEMAEEIEAATKLVDQSVIGNLEASVSEIGSRLDATEGLHTQTMDMVGDTVNRVVESVDQRLTANEEQQNKAIEQVGSQVARISESLDKRIGAVEDDLSQQATLREDMRRLSDSINERMDQFENLDTSALDAVSNKVEQLADMLDERIIASEQLSASAIEQVGEQVASVAARMDHRQDEAFRIFSEKLDDVQKRQATRLSDALSNVSDRLEQMQQQQVTTISPVQKAIASLAQRMEAIEDFTTPPYAERGEVPDIPEMVEPTTIDTSLTGNGDVDLFEGDDPLGFSPFDEVASPNAETGVASTGTQGDDTFEAGLESWAATATADPLDIDPLADSPAARTVDLAADETSVTVEDEHNYLADLPEPETSWADSANETRDSDIFDEDPVLMDPPEQDPASIETNIDAFEAAAEAIIEDDIQVEPENYLNRARAAARAAAETDENAKKKKKRGKKEPNSKAEKQDQSSDATAKAASKDGKGLGQVPKIAAVSALAIATAGTAGYLYVRGKQTAPALSLNDITGNAATKVASISSSDADPIETASLEPEADTGGGPDRLSLFAARIEDIDLDGGSISEAAPKEIVDNPETALFDALPLIADVPTAEEAAADGDPIAMLHVGLAKLESGDTAEGSKLVQSAAGEGIAAAQYRLAKLHEQGLGVARDIQEARAWTERAANGGNVKAMHDLAHGVSRGGIVQLRCLQ
ncbi:MAG: hypothetical protein AAFS13_03920, partial [Pseudomonadota bacterium]